MNGVKQGGIVSPIMFCVYLDKLLLSLAESGVGCYISRFFVGASALSSVRITKMLMRGRVRERRERKKIFSCPSWGPGKVTSQLFGCELVRNSANCFMLFIVNSTKSFLKPVVTTVIYLVYN